MNYEYLYLHMLDNIYSSFHSATKKIIIVSDFLHNTDYDILVFLDTDAWIENQYWLNDIIMNLINTSEKYGCFSRDPYLSHNTFVNSGSFILKNNGYTKQMYNMLLNNLRENDEFHDNTMEQESIYYRLTPIQNNLEGFSRILLFIQTMINTDFQIISLMKNIYI